MKRGEDVRSWLRRRGHGTVVAKIDIAIRKWAREGKKTRRNWWDILAGDKNGNPRRVHGIAFPVIEAARRRQMRLKLSSRAVQIRRKVVDGSAPKTKRGRAEKTQPTRSALIRKSLEVLEMKSVSPRPFIKWAGGKRQLFAEIDKRVTKPYRTYHEPFLGGGAVFFALSPPTPAFLSDSNERLVRCYKGIKNDVMNVITLLKKYEKDRGNRDFFLKLRESDIDGVAEDYEVAAWFIFLNKTGFNGLYRVNSKNRFNVPYGDNRTALICDEENLMACSCALKNATITHEDFSEALRRPQPGDLVYLDPPYMPLSATSYFTAYTAGGFSYQDQERLRDEALRLKRKGVHVLLSNSSSAAKLYDKKDFILSRVLATRLVNSKVERRGKIAELLIRGRNAG